jgi:Phytochelatin synthase
VPERHGPDDASAENGSDARWRSDERVTRRTRRVIVGAASLLLVALFAVVLRLTVLVPHFDVVSIATLPEYKDASLLEKAWALPGAAAYERRVVSQSNGSLCGPATLANALRSLGEGAATEALVLEGSGKCRTGYCIPGLTLDEVAELARTKTRREVTVLRDLTLDEFREHLRRSNDASRRYLVNFQRGLLFGEGTGHHSPIGGYLVERDLVLVLDVNEKFGPWLVPAERLFVAMDSVDPSSKRKRGMVLLAPNAACLAAVVARVTQSELARGLVASRKTELMDAPRTLPPSDIFLYWQVQLFEDAATRAPSLPYFYVDPRTGALKQRDHANGGLADLPADPPRSAAVVAACAGR